MNMKDENIANYIGIDIICCILTIVINCIQSQLLVARSSAQKPRLLHKAKLYVINVANLYT